MGILSILLETHEPLQRTAAAPVVMIVTGGTPLVGSGERRCLGRSLFNQKSKRLT
jgi:hypothetical protein